MRKSNSLFSKLFSSELLLQELPSPLVTFGVLWQSSSSRGSRILDSKIVPKKPTNCIQVKNFSARCILRANCAEVLNFGTIWRPCRPCKKTLTSWSTTKFRPRSTKLGRFIWGIKKLGDQWGGLEKIKEKLLFLCFSNNQMCQKKNSCHMKHLNSFKTHLFWKESKIWI